MTKQLDHLLQSSLKEKEKVENWLRAHLLREMSTIRIWNL